MTPAVFIRSFGSLAIAAPPIKACVDRVQLVTEHGDGIPAEQAHPTSNRAGSNVWAGKQEVLDSVRWLLEILGYEPKREQFRNSRTHLRLSFREASSPHRKGQPVIVTSHFWPKNRCDRP
jgi:hypothetical protein